MHDRVAGELDAHFKGSAYQHDDDLVFGHPLIGRPLDGSKITKQFQKALKVAKVRRVRFHDLRHTFGTRMAAAGVPMRTLQGVARASQHRHDDDLRRLFAIGARGGSDRGDVRAHCVA